MKEIKADSNSSFGLLLQSGFEVMPEHANETQRFHYARPLHTLGRNRSATRLATTDILLAMVQTFRPGCGEKRLHAHAAMDGFWLVLNGRARFYDEIGDWIEVGPMEGTCIPRGVYYWFENSGEDDLEILQVEAIDPRSRNIIHFGDQKGPPVNIVDELKTIGIFDAQA